jgi:hypothetical protein
MQPNLVRDIAFQPFTTVVVAVQITPTPIWPVQNKADLVDSFVLSVDAGAANNVFVGDQGVTINSGIEVVRGTGPVNFIIHNQNMHYEIISYLADIAEILGCRQPNMPKTIPFIIWDLTQVYLVAAAITSVRVAIFRSQFI